MRDFSEKVSFFFISFIIENLELIPEYFHLDWKEKKNYRLDQYYDLGDLGI